MLTTISILTLISLIGLLFAIIALISITTGVKVASLSKDGIFKYALYALLFSGAISFFTATRDLSMAGGLFETGHNSGFIGEWSTRIASLLILLASLERFLYFFRQQQINFSKLGFALILAYVWITNFLIPTVYTSGEMLKLSNFYSLALVIGIALTIQQNRDELILHARNALILFVLISLLAIPIRPSVVLEMGYSQGFIPGLPRFYGLTPFATVMGTISALAFLLLLTYPYMDKLKKYNKPLLAIMFLAMFIAQSKTVFISFTLGIFFYLFYKKSSHQQANQRGTFTPIQTFLLLAIGFVTSLILLSFIFVDWKNVISHHLSPSQIHNLMTLTGRDVIWRIALDEFYANPIFGYGIELFSPRYRAEIDMSFATHGHNLFIDALGRSGLIGFSGYLLLFIFLAISAFKLAKQTKGLSVTLFVILSVNSITQVPITWENIGTAQITFYLLLIIITTQIDLPKQNFDLSKNKYLIPT